VSDETFTFHFDSDGSEEGLARELANILTRAFGQAATQISRDLARMFSGNQGTREAAAGARRFSREATAAIKDVTEALNRMDTRLTDIRTAFGKIGSSATGEFDEFVHGVTRARVGAEEFDAAMDRMARDPNFRRAMTANLEALVKLSSQQGRSANKVLGIQETAFAKEAEAARVAGQRQTTAERTAAAERIVTLQTESAREVALTKRSAQLRVEVIRAAMNQIRALERGLAAVFRGTARVVEGSFRALGSVFRTITAPLRNFTVSLTAGLSASLHRRSSMLKESFESQESFMRASTRRQEIIMQKLDTRLSKGVIGAATGRSRLGGLFGGIGAAFGGAGLLIGLQKLATAGADFTQSLAVLQAQLSVSDRQMGKVRKTALDLGNDISLPGVSALDAVQAIQLLTKQFGSMGKQAVPAATAAAKGVLQLSRATQSSAEEAAAVVGQAVNVFGLEADQATSVADQVTGALTKAAGVGFGDFALAFKQGASVFAQFQVPAVGATQAITDFNTVIAVLAKGGLIGSDAGTSLKQFFLQANRGTKDSVKNLKALTERAGETGTAFFDASGKARPLGDALEIMRKGLKGLTDQERTKTLQKIFGSDAIRAANILLGTSQETFDTIEKGIRKSGTAARIAAAQNQGLRGAMDALGSVIETQGILVYEKFNIVVGNAVTAVAEFLNLLLTADEGPFKIIRDGLKGIAVGLGAVLAVKTAVEVIRLLGPAISGLLTPFGLLVAAAAGIGAAFFVLRDSSEGFRDALKRMGTIFGDLVAAISDAAAPIIDSIKEQFGGLQDAASGGADFLERVGTTIGNALVTGLKAVADFIVNTAIPAIRRFVEFIRGTVIPGLQRFAGFVTGTVLPAIGRFFVRAFEAALNAVKRFWHTVEPIIRPAIDGFHRLGDSVRGLVGSFKDFSIGDLGDIGIILGAATAGFAVGGPLGAVVAGAGAAIATLFSDSLGKGLLDTLGNIGGVIIDALKGPFDAVKGALSDFFDPGNLADVIFKVADLAERVGFVIGNVLSDPRLLAAVAGAAGALALIGIRIVQGIAEGILDNIDDIAQMLRDAFAAVFREVFSDITGINVSGDLSKVFTVGLAGALTLAIGAPRLIGIVSSGLQKLGLIAGTQFGQAIQKGTAQSLTVGGAGFGAGPRGLIQGLFGGPSIIRAAQQQAQKISTAVIDEITRTNRTMTALGRQPIDWISSKTVSQNLQRARDLRSGLVREFGAARVAGIEFRTALGTIGTAIRQADFRGFKEGLSNLRSSLQGQGKNIATGVGTLIATGIGAAFGARMVVEGKDMGQKLLGALSFAGSVAAAAAVSGPLGVVTAGVGLLSGAISLLGGHAAETDTHMKDLVNTIKTATDPIDAMITEITTRFSELPAATQLAFDGLRLSITDVFKQTPLQGSAVETFWNNLAQQFPEVEAALVGVNRESLRSFQIFDDQMPALQAFFEGKGIDKNELRDILNLIQGGFIDYRQAVKLADAQNRAFGDNSKEAFGDATTAADLFEQRFQKAFGHKETAANVIGAIGGVKDKLDETKTAAENAATEIGKLFGLDDPQTLQQKLNDLIIGLQGLPSRLQGLDMGTLLGTATFTATADEAVNNFLEAANTAISEGQITSIPDLTDFKEKYLAGLKEILSGGEEGFTGVEQQLLANVTKALDIKTVGREINKQFKKAGKEQRVLDLLIRVNPQLKGKTLAQIRAELKKKGQDLDSLVQSLSRQERRAVRFLVRVDPQFKGMTFAEIMAHFGETREELLARVARIRQRQAHAVQVLVRMNPRFQGLTFAQIQAALGEARDKIFAQIRQARQAAAHANQVLAEHGAVEMPIPVKPVVPKITLTRAQRRDLRAIADPIKEAFPPGAKAVGVPIPVKPIAKVQKPDRRLRSKIRQTVVDAVGGKAKPISVPIPLKINPQIQPLSDDEVQTALTTAMSSSRTIGGGGARAPITTIQETKTIDLPITINPIVSISGGSGASTGIGSGIATAIATGVAAGAPLIASTLARALTAALRASGAVAGQFRAVGAEAASQMAVGIGSEAGNVAAVATIVGAAATQGAANGSSGMDDAGVAAGALFAIGVASMAGSAANAGASLGSGAASGVGGTSLFDEGAAAGLGFVLGVLSMVGAAFRAGQQLGNAVEAGARSTLAIGSPSKVFRNIGRDVGRGFVKGIEDSASDISSAMSSAIDGAINKLQKKVRLRFAVAVGASELFERTQLPSKLPGGPTQVDVERALLDVRDAIFNFHHDLHQQQEQFRKDFEQEARDARKHRDELIKTIQETRQGRDAAIFGRRQAQIDISRERINLGGIGDDLRDALKDSMTETTDDGKKILHKTLDLNNKFGRANANVILDQGQRIRDFGQQLLDSGVRARVAVKEMKQYRNALVAQAVKMGFSRKQVEALLKTVGLSDEQLARYVERVKKAKEADTERIKRIREETRDKIADNREQLRKQLERSKDLSTSTAAGRQNRRNVLDSLQSIRDFGTEALKSGAPVGQVVRQMKGMRDRFIAGAKSMGLNGKQLHELVKMLGLTDAQLKAFTKSVKDLKDEVDKPVKPPGTPGGPGRLPGPLVGSINISVPYGDPEAIGMAVANRLAWQAA
jgi:TP901 family phage tail tape measure protein